jgi:glucose dehydrogenase
MGPILTASGLIFIGGTDDARFRAFDSKTGKLLWTYKLDYSATDTPIPIWERTASSMWRWWRPAGR